MPLKGFLALFFLGCCIACGTEPVLDRGPYRTTVGPEGATIAAPVGSPISGAILRIPAGAFDRQEIVTLREGVAIDFQASLSQSSVNGTVVGPVVVVESSRGMLAQAATLTLPYSPVAITSGFSPQSLLVVRIEGSGVVQVISEESDGEAPRASLDLTAGTLTVKTKAFSAFAVVASKSASSRVKSVANVGCSSGAAPLLAQIIDDQSLIGPLTGLNTFGLPARTKPVDFIVVHSTDSPPGQTLSEVLTFGYSNSCGPCQAHYYIDRDGSTYRLVAENFVAFHAIDRRQPPATSDLNGTSIGIELLQHVQSGAVIDAPAFTDVQYQSLRDLLRGLHERYPSAQTTYHTVVDPPPNKYDPRQLDPTRSVSLAACDITYSISTSSSPSNGGSTSGGGTYAAGSSVTVLASAATGYSFLNWAEGGSQLSTSASYTFTASSNRSLVASFTAIALPAAIMVSGGTSFGNTAGQSGFGVIYNPLTSAGTATFVDVRGPAGWNSGNAIRFDRYQPPGIAPSRSINWVSTVSPLTGEYTGDASVGGQLLSGRFSIDAGAKLVDPQITGLIVGFGQVAVEWTASPAAKSFLVRVNPFPFTGVAGITGETVVGSSVRSVTLTGLSLVGGAQYQAAVFAFNQDVVTPGNMQGQFNISGTSTVFTPPLGHALTVTGSGTGSGGVSSNVGGINCSITLGNASGTCTASFNSGTSVTLTATPVTGHAFTGWSGPCSGSGSCTVSMTESRIVTASFFASPPTYTIRTSSNPSNGGSTSGGGAYTAGSSVTIAASAASGYAFVNWTENGSQVSSSASYTFTASANRSLVANFSFTVNPVLTITGSGTGSGTVTSNVGGINCSIAAGSASGNCSASFSSGASVSLTATPVSGHTFTGWSGACTGTGSCTVGMTQNRSVTATFLTVPGPLSGSWLYDTFLVGQGFQCLVYDAVRANIVLQLTQLGSSLSGSYQNITLTCIAPDGTIFDRDLGAGQISGSVNGTSVVFDLRSGWRNTGTVFQVVGGGTLLTGTLNATVNLGATWGTVTFTNITWNAVR